MTLHDWLPDDSYQFGNLMGPEYEQLNEGMSMSKDERHLIKTENKIYFMSDRSWGFDLLQSRHFSREAGLPTLGGSLKLKPDGLLDPSQIRSVPESSGPLLQFETQDFAIMDREIDDRQADITILHQEKKTEKMQSIGNISPSGKYWESTDFNMNTLPFTCNWTGYFNKTFTRKSDLRKHCEKHTKPYVCEELSCNGIAFGDKASLHRHETEKHGKHDAKRYLCPVESCPRARKGFPRKRNRDVHMSTRHNTLSTIIDRVTREGSEGRTSEIPEQTIEEILSTKLSGEVGEMATIENISGLELKLVELEKEKSELDLRRSRVDEDIKALRRTIQLVAA
ncbi:hypothetical protein G7Y89_g9308 [Cudoniella acicularis]|uniref:C2H2-type domain-containing protein n=1 Tax=Cudoniella acicularis TaxID=354080 RepID=A0A8H4W078_9HELO|nr:hypothetical protein G7Y89_g9308 [Cudoniella acicularis]